MTETRSTIGTVDEKSVVEAVVLCSKCGIQIHKFSEFTGLLPDENHGERRAAHSWLVCELWQRLNVAASLGFNVEPLR